MQQDSLKEVLHSRRDRLQAVAQRLEQILAELDDFGDQRSAIDVCMALNRLQAQIAHCDQADEVKAPLSDWQGTALKNNRHI